MSTKLSSLFKSVEVDRKKLFIIGERANATGSLKFRNALLDNDFDMCVNILLSQEESGADALDLSVGYSGRDEKNDMSIIIKKSRSILMLPLMIDSTSIETIEEALKNYPGKAIINSINLESGEQNLIKICKLVRKYNGSVVGLVIDKSGMALTLEKKIEIAEKIIFLAESEGIKRENIFIDMLTFSLATGDKKYVTSAVETLKAIKQIKILFPEVKTVLGVSNISFGLKPQSRKILNNAFINEAIKYGLDAVIINPNTIIGLTDEENRLALNLIYNKSENALEDFIYKFSEKKINDICDSKKLKLEKILFNRILTGDKFEIEKDLDELLKKFEASYIIDDILIKAMEEVGRRFGTGDIVLPFVLKAAETMKKAVNYLKPFLKNSKIKNRATILIATVAGDVHDIGKNLVGIILENNGFTVIDAGVKVPIEKIIELYNIHKPDIIGLSGLLVKSSILMKDYLVEFETKEIDIPITLGGAALNKSYVEAECSILYSGGVFYSKDAFDILQIPLKKRV